MRSSDAVKLSSIVGAAIATRALGLGISRPEFAGWFNHTYYYFVQVRGLLEQGSLPYPDMPLLFHLYALVAKGLMAMGWEPEAAIVLSTRSVMVVVPALLPLPIYGVIKAMSAPQRVRAAQWVIIGAAGFLPLTMSHLPQTLQKNTLGLLLLAVLIFYSQRLLRGARPGDMIAAALVGVLIVLSHFGTFAAMVLYGVAVLLAWVGVHRSLGRALVPALTLLIGSGAAVGLIYFLDIHRFHRLYVYLADSVTDSLVGALLLGEGSNPRVLTTLAGLTIFYLSLALLHRIYKRFGSELVAGDRVFWLANILFSGLLVLPVLDEALMGRLGLFMSLPMLIILAHCEHFAMGKRWMRRTIMALVAIGVLVLAVGELVSERIHNANHQAVFSDIRAVDSRQILTSGDLVITRTGAEHVCNWFYGVKAGVITSLTLADFDTYDRIFVLNPLQGAMVAGTVEAGTADSEDDRYRFMLRNVPRPEGVEPVFKSETLEIYELEVPPPEWVFDTDGRWRAYSLTPESTAVSPARD